MSLEPAARPERLYSALGLDVNPHRPLFTGDVFSSVGIPGVGESAAIVIGHPARSAVSAPASPGPGPKRDRCSRCRNWARETLSSPLSNPQRVKECVDDDFRGTASE